MNTGTKQGPTLRRHKRSGRSYVRFNGQQVWFGPFDDPATHARFAAFKAEWEANGRQLPGRDDDAPATVADLVASYLVFAETYYRKPDKTPTHEIENVRYTVRPLLELYGQLSVAEFDLRRLKLLRERMIDSGLSRSTVNNRVSRVVRVFGWGTEEELVPPQVFGALRALRPLRAGRSRAPETEPVRPVPWEDVEAVLGHVSRVVRAMILLQWHSGMRPAEVIQLRPADLDRSAPVLLYRPRRHKLEHHGKERVIALGPQAQEVLMPFFHRVPQPAPESPLFSPRDAVAEMNDRKRRNRTTPLWPSHRRANARKRRARPKLEPGENYTVASYRRAIERGCKEAGVPPWSPNQLRHAAATRIRAEMGLEAARVVLGHSSAVTTEVYAELDQSKAVQIMAQLG